MRWWLFSPPAADGALFAVLCREVTGVEAGVEFALERVTGKDAGGAGNVLALGLRAVGEGHIVVVAVEGRCCQQQRRRAACCDGWRGGGLPRNCFETAAARAACRSRRALVRLFLFLDG